MTDLSAAQERGKNQIVLEQYMTTTEICRALNLPHHVIKYALDKGKLAAYAINGRLKLKTEEVLKLKEERDRKLTERESIYS
jgi:excisionase family DNA binding protein